MSYSIAIAQNMDVERRVTVDKPLQGDAQAIGPCKDNRIGLQRHRLLHRITTFDKSLDVLGLVGVAF